jgi:hypothetical protein
MLTKEETRLRIESYRELEKGWDGYHADPIPPQAIDNALSLLDMLDHTPEVFPTGVDAVQFGFECNKYELEVFIYADREEVFVYYPDWEDLVPLGAEVYYNSMRTEAFIRGFFISHGRIYHANN